VSGGPSEPTGEVGAALAGLDSIVADCRARRSVLGYFPAVYRAVTVNVGAGLGQARFEEPELVERLVAAFATRYGDAYRAHGSGGRPSRSWAAAFALAAGRRRTILQHLLASVNAHINLDLGVAAADVSETLDATSLQRFERDFDRVNAVLFALMDTLQDGLNDVSPWMGVLDRIGCRWDEGLMRLTIGAARDGAWAFGRSLTDAGEQRAELLEARDGWTAGLASVIDSPSGVARAACWVVLLRESRDVPAVIDHLCAVTVDPGRLAVRAASLNVGPTR
jgi:Family of unknown function (DUF5995)